MTNESSGPKQIALQNVTANVIRIGTISQTINYTQRPIALSSVVNEGLPPLPDAAVWQSRPEEQQLREWLMAGKLRLVGLEGAGGYGKSAMAAQVCRMDLGFDQAPLWVNFQAPIAFGTFARWVIKQLMGEEAYDRARETYERLGEADLLEKVLGDLAQSRCLVVLDNLETLFQSEALWAPYGDFLAGWLGRSGGGCVVLTSQYRLELPMASRWEWLGLWGLENPQGVVLLRAEGVIGEERDLAEFVRLADGHPLLLTLAVNLLKKRQKEDYESPAILQLGQDGVSMLRGIVELHRGDAEASVGKVLDASFERLYPEWMRVLLWRSSVLRGQFGLTMVQGMIDQPVELTDLRRLARWSFLREEKVQEAWQFDFLPLIARYLQLGAQDQEQLEIAHERAIGYYSANFQEWDGTIESCRAELESFYHACELGQYQRAIEMLNRCYEMLNRAGKWQLLLPLYVRLTTEWQVADYTEAKNLGSAWTSLGNLKLKLGNDLEAIDAHLRALNIFDQLGFAKGKARSLGNLGNAYDSLGQHQQAFEFHLQSLEIKREIGDRNGEAAALGNLGNSSYSLGQYQQAIKFHLQNYKIASEIGDRGSEAAALGNLGNVYRSVGQYQQAIAYHLRHNEIAQEIGDPWGEATSLFNMGLTLENLNRQTEALDHFQQAKTIFTELQLEHMIERCDRNIQSCQ
jgi:tetratricopeptide (TPR) repeat protein